MAYTRALKSGLDFFQDNSGIFSALSEPTGFPNRTDSSWSFVGDTLTISPVGASYNIWFKGVLHTISANKTIAIADTEGEHLIYFDTDDTLKEIVNPTTAQWLTLIRDKVLVALIYWDATNDVAVYVGEERHGIIMDGITHYYLHYTRGLQYVSGLGLGDFVIGDGSLDSHAQFSVASGSVSDEDIGITISAIASTTGLPILYRSGATGDWRGLTQAGFSCYKNPAGVTNRLMYNQFTGGAWQTTEIGEGNYVLYHIFATTGKTYQMYSIMGQNEYTTLPSARNGAQVEISALLLGSLPSPEIRPIATVIFQTDKDYANSINARIIEVDGVGTDDYVDWRTNDLPRGTVAGDHGSLTGLSDNDHNQYALLDGSNQPFTGNLVVGVNTTPLANIHVYQTDIPLINTFCTGIRSQITRTTALNPGAGANSFIIAGLYSAVMNGATTSGNTYVRGLQGAAWCESSATGTIVALQGLVFPVYNVMGAGGSITAAECVGVSFNHRGAANVTNLYGLKYFGLWDTGGTGTITNAYGAYIDNTAIQAKITNSYGLYIANTSGTSTSYAIYTNSGQVRFGDNLTVNGRVQTDGGRIGKITTATDTYNVLTSDETVLCNKSSEFTLTLPTASTGQMFHFKNIGTGVAVIDGAGTDTIDGVPNYRLNPSESVTIQCSSANTWRAF